jgi:hypothetical protein
MRGDIKWTNLSRRQIAERMGALGTPVSRDVVSQLLRQHGYRRRKAQKKKTMGHHRDRNAQFEKIARLRKKYLKAGLPVISIDTKKKELLGDFYREGRIDAQATIETNADRTPAVPSLDACLPRRDISNAGNSTLLHGEGKHASRLDRDGDDA